MSPTSFADGSSECTTRGIRVMAWPEYLPDQSEPARGQWFWAYQITIQNHGDRAVQLLARHWIITNAAGREEHIRGPGVVGEQPVIEPGGSFRYTSGASLDTRMGTMHGTYQMLVPSTGERFDAEIAPFVLAEPYAIN